MQGTAVEGLCRKRGGRPSYEGHVIRNSGFALEACVNWKAALLDGR
jgi:hypothetical protein